MIGVEGRGRGLDRVGASGFRIRVKVTEAGSFSRLIDFCITQLKAQGPSRFCNESKEEEEVSSAATSRIECVRLVLGQGLSDWG